MEERSTASQLIYSGRVIKLRVDDVQLPDGRTTKREIVEHRGAVAIIAIDDSGNVILVRQFRKAVERQLLEIPAGTLEPDEAVDVCARRELEEETGFRARRWERLVSFYTAPGFCNELLHLFLASELSPGPARPESDEHFELVQLPLARCLELIESGDICDAKSIIGLLCLKVRELAAK